MADEPVVQQDTDGTPTESDALPENTGSEASTPESPKLLFGKYKDESEAEKAFKELEHKLGEQGEQVGTLRRQLGEVQERTQLSEVLAKLSERMEHKQPEVDFDKFADELASGMAENPTEATKKLLKAVGSWTANDRETLLKEIKSLKEDLGKVRGEITERLESSDSFYNEHRDMIEKMRKGGMSLSAAKEFLKEIVKDKDSGSSNKPPVSLNGGSRTAAKSSGSYLSVQEREDMKKEGFTDDEIESMEVTYKRNLARKEREQREKESA